MFRYLVTGGCGSIGSALVKRLLIQGHQVCSFDITEDGLFHQNRELKSQYVDLYKPFLGDIRDRDRLTQALKNVDYVYHCAALKHVALCEYNPFEALKTNVLGTENLVEACINNGVKKMVFASSDKAVNPTGTMGATKLLAEKLITSANNYAGSQYFKCSCVRFGNVWASNGSVGLIFCEQSKTGQPLTVTSREMTRFFIDKNSALELCEFAMENMEGGEIFICDMGALNIYDLATTFNEYFENKKPIQLIGMAPGEKLYEELFTETEAAFVGTYKNYYIVIPEGLISDTTKDAWERKPEFHWQDSNNPLLSANSPKQTDVKHLINLITLNAI
ncbi:SDR family NAD(P)-dependent oxidoreductase [Synechococcus sp. CBW1107]|uniref:SDR family NAD(P)-dependent oxidoreductase n=1 Tax=Synechococcus sp. CBW1107 TaxID=2789857 RepID=UPI002AD3262F|nr:SDR family NAD(P)-dependent oxidoreductase [Synechococcus sp. CBW1107]